MHVLIAGGGLSGLCLAHGLIKRGHTVQVFERDGDLSRKAGYVLNVNADGGEALRSCLPDDLFALYVETSHRTPARRGTIVYDDQLHELSSMPHLGPPNDGPQPHTAVHRRALRQILQARLGAVLRTGTAAVDFQEIGDRVRLELSDGATVEGDVLVGADGIRSAIRRRRLPAVELIEAGIAGIGVYGRSPLTPAVIDRLPPALTQNIAMAADRSGHRLLLGPLRPRRPVGDALAANAPDVALDPIGDYVMVSCSVPADTPVPRAADWTHETPRTLRDAMLRALDGWHPDLRGFVERIELESMFEVSFGRLDPPTPWEPSRVTLIGDAAHAMLPTLGMGANLALRDARGLAERLNDTADAIDAIAESEHAMREYAYPLMRMTVQHDEHFGGGGLKTLSPEPTPPFTR